MGGSVVANGLPETELTIDRDEFDRAFVTAANYLSATRDHESGILVVGGFVTEPQEKDFSGEPENE